MILVDSNVLIDIISGDPRWAKWSAAQLADLSDHQALAINEIVLAEVGPSCGSVEAFWAEMTLIAIQHEPLSQEGAYHGGIAFRAYSRKRRTVHEASKSILPDFLIGGHAHVLGATILTRDPRFYRTYFPDVPLISPTKDTNE